jgi:hypothetical protein
MNDPRRPEWFSPPLPGSGSTEPLSYQTPPLTDPAYADQAPYGPTYGGQSQWAPNPNQIHPTQELPRYWQEGQARPDEAPQQGLAPSPPEGPTTPRWLLVAAIVAVLLVVASVIALIIANGANKTQTAVEPLPPMPTPTLPTTTRHPHTPSAAPAPPTTSPVGPTETTEPGVMQPVVYSVTGEGRAISISYLDAGDVVQTLFNVALPWSIEVSLAKSAAHPPILTIINIGHNVTCSVTVAGLQVRQRVGQGITICDAPNN